MTTATAYRTREYRKCPSCGEARHEYMFPFADPAADTHPRAPRSVKPKALADYAKRLVEAARIRLTAQAKGRDFDACLPCRNGDA